MENIQGINGWAAFVSGETDFYRLKTIHWKKQKRREKWSRGRRWSDKSQVGSIQVSTGQPEWLGPEKGDNGSFKSCRSQAHHGCSPDPLHVWLPIAAIPLVHPLPLCLYMVVFPITATGKENERERKINRWIWRSEGRAGRNTESTGMSAAFSGQGWMQQ